MSTNYSYGNKGITSCAFCDEELTDKHPGKIAKLVHNDKTYKETICDECLVKDPDYKNNVDELMDFPNDYDII